MDEATKEAMAKWLAEGNEITRETEEQVIDAPATREGSEGQRITHVHIWRPDGSRFRCDSCGCAGHRRKHTFTRKGSAKLQRKQSIVEYVCYVEGCEGWGAQIKDGVARRYWLCPEHAVDAEESE